MTPTIARGFELGTQRRTLPIYRRNQLANFGGNLYAVLKVCMDDENMMYEGLFLSNTSSL